MSSSPTSLDWPPATPPPLLVGAIRERTMALAGELGDGVILTGETTVAALLDAMPHLRAGRTRGGRAASGDVVVFSAIVGRPDATEVAGRVRELAAAGATHVILLSVADGPELEDFVRLVAHDVRALVD